MVPREGSGRRGSLFGRGPLPEKGTLRAGGPGRRSAEGSGCQACPGGARCPRRGTDRDRDLGTAISSRLLPVPAASLLFSRISQLEERKAPVGFSPSYSTSQVSSLSSTLPE
ncbi:unnamed protein product [Coccothraustes coccothraustes]